MTKTESFSLKGEGELIWAVVGGSGFVGSGIIDALKKTQVEEIRSIRSPRLSGVPISGAHEAVAIAHRELDARKATADLAQELEGSDVVINAAGIAAPDSTDTASLYGANVLLPLIIAEAAKRVGARRFIHISSAAVQGRRQTLDESSEVEPFSAYSWSKSLGEQALTLWTKCQPNGESKTNVVVIRATSVQGPTRNTTASLRRIARSPLASIAKPGDQPSVVSSLYGLSIFVVKVGVYSGRVPHLLIQPWEGASVRDVMELAGGGRSPRLISTRLARGGISLLNVCGLVYPRLKGAARRLEVMWFGQDQVAGWAVEKGLVAGPIDGPTDSLRIALAPTQAISN